MEWQRDLKDPTEFIETVKIDLFQDEVFVFTPKGDVKALPKGATPIDFAYAIHSEVGEHCSGARVNGLIVPLRYALRNGDTVEILTSANQKPSKDWLKFVITSRAQHEDPRTSSGMEQRERSRAAGPRAARARAAQAGLLARRPRSARAGSSGGRTRLRLGTADELLVAVGYGKVSPAHAADAVLDRSSRAGGARRRRAAAPRRRAAARRAAPPSGRSAGITVQGEADILVKFAKCCTPVPGDSIVGFISRGHGVVIHTRDCPKALDLDPVRRVDVALGRRIQDAAPGGGPGHLRGPPGPAGGDLQVVHRARGQHLAGQVPDHRGRPGREHLPGHGRPPRPAQDRAPEPRTSISRAWCSATRL